MSTTEKYLVTIDAATQEVTRLEKVGEAGELRELSLEGVQISGLGEDKGAASSGVGRQRTPTRVPQPPAIIVGGPHSLRRSRKSGEEGSV